MNKPHLTPNPDKSRVPGPPEKSGDLLSDRRHTPNPYHSPSSGTGPDEEATTYDSCFDDLNLLLSQSIQKPDPDPNLESSSAANSQINRDESSPGLEGGDKPPRTSEIFRLVVGATNKTPSNPTGSKPRGTPTSRREISAVPESTVPDVVLDRDQQTRDLASEEADGLSEPRFSWSHVLLSSYSSAITLAMVWMLWSGRWSKSALPSTGSSIEAPSEFSSRVVNAAPDIPPPPIPAENLATIGKTIRVGELEITPLSVIAAPVELRRSIDPDTRRREEPALILRLKLTNVSKDRAFVPLEQSLVRERGVRPFDPYVETSQGKIIQLFPLAIDSEWAIVGQEFATLQPGEAEETVVVAESGSAENLGEELTWRVRLRIGVYRTDMIGVRFSKDEVGHPGSGGSVGNGPTLR